MLKLYFHPFKIKWNAVCLVFKSKDLPALFKTLYFVLNMHSGQQKEQQLALYGVCCGLFWCGNFTIIRSLLLTVCAMWEATI